MISPGLSEDYDRKKDSFRALAAGCRLTTRQCATNDESDLTPLSRWLGQLLIDEGCQLRLAQGAHLGRHKLAILE